LSRVKGSGKREGRRRRRGECEGWETRMRRGTRTRTRRTRDEEGEEGNIDGRSEIDDKKGLE
jgi:hypothetical protein